MLLLLLLLLLLLTVDCCAPLSSGGEEEEEDTVVAVDAYELLEAVDILAKLPKDFFEKIVSSINTPC